ncbi:Protein of unknown function DUF3313 [Burkholderiaceae bacterium]
MRDAKTLFLRSRLVVGAGLCALVGGALTGCKTYEAALGTGENVTAIDAARLTQSGFLTNYAKLKPVAAMQGIECWRDTRFDPKKYKKIQITPIVVSLTAPKDSKDGKVPTVDPTDLKQLTDYFYQTLHDSLKPQIPVVAQAGAGVVVLRIALTDLVPTSVPGSVAGTLIPYAFIAEASSGKVTGRPAGSTPYLGETGMEMQFRDGATGAVLAECRDTEIGRKYAAELNAGAAQAAQTWANGYMSSFQSWGYAKAAFNKWSMLVAKRVADLQQIQPTP